MPTKFLLFITFIIGLLVGLELFRWFNFGFPFPTLSDLADIAQLVIALGIPIGFLSYFQQKEQDRRSSVADQVRMYRLEVMKLAEASFEKIKKIDPTYKPLLIQGIEEFSFKWVLANFPKAIKSQNDLLIKLEANSGTWRYEIANLLNAMEELALNIRLKKTEFDEGLIPIRKGFVEFTESNIQANLLLSSYDETMYINLKRIYLLWKDKVDRTPVEDKQRRFNEDLAEIARSRQNH